MSEPIPGPWTWTADPEPFSSNISIEADGEVIAIVTIGDWDMPIGSGEATARLICAAPELYESARLALGYLDDLCKIWGNKGFLKRRADGLRAAITKATKGEQVR